MDKEEYMKITFPDGRMQDFKYGSTGYDIAKSISPSLLKKAIAIEINGAEQDLCENISCDASVSILTLNDNKGLNIMRHTLTAQVLAKALKNLYPDVKLAIGPTIENGFYYDFELDKSVTVGDLPIIEKEMRKIISSGNDIEKKYLSKEKVIDLFNNKNETYKVDIIQRSEQQENFSTYNQKNTDFVDLCFGPHLPSLKYIGPFKLTKVAGAYWQGDSKNKMLQRIYGTAWKNEDDLKKYLNMLEEAEKRDHRKIGKKLDLFHLQEEAMGSVFWHDKGWKIFLEIEAYIRNKLNSQGYKEVKTPQIIDRTLWEKSGHWSKFKENMFLAKGDENKVLALKPMNCPGHVEIFKQGLKSYRDLPIRMAEFGSCHRNEPSGALHGIMRVRQFTQDDAHIFCTESQVTQESLKFCDLLRKIYQDFGFQELKVKFSDRPKERAGSDQVWDKAEKALLKAVKEAKLKYELNPGEGAFYGPKLEFVLTDAIGRDWQCGTLQMDFVLPERLEATYIDENGHKKYPVMLHRAILGSIERWIGIIIEQYSGKFPIWLAPTQITICTITEKNYDYAKTIDKNLKNSGIRTELDNRNEKIGYKIREHSDKKVPIILVVGDKESSTESVSIRKLGNKEFEQMKFNKFIKVFREELEIK